MIYKNGDFWEKRVKFCGVEENLRAFARKKCKILSWIKIFVKKNCEKCQILCRTRNLCVTNLFFFCLKLDFFVCGLKSRRKVEFELNMQLLVHKFGNFPL
jgi:hypothetical protein